MNETSGLRVSVDVGCYQHSVAVGLVDGTLLDEFELSHDPAGFDRFFKRIDGLCERHGNMVSVAMEGYNGWHGRWTRWSARKAWGQVLKSLGQVLY